MERNEMTIQQFADNVLDHLFDTHPGMEETHNAEIKEVLKNNGQMREALVLKANDENIAPTIYLEKFFDDFKDGALLGDICDKIIDMYEQSRNPQNISVDFFTDFDQAKERLAMKVVNAEKNAQMLEDTPHFKFGDLAAIFQVQVDSNEYGSAVITVKDQHMKMWDTDPQSMLEYAKANMEEKQPVRIQSMMDVLREMMGGNAPEELLPADDPQMYVMTNDSKINGAAAMIFTDKIDDFAKDIGANLFILPSSIHEVLLVPDNGQMNVQELEDMVKNVNRTQVSPDEVLSDNVYIYDREAKSLQIASTKEPLVLECVNNEQSRKNAEKTAHKASDKVAQKADRVSEEAHSIKDRLVEGKEKSAMSLGDVSDKLPQEQGRDLR